MIPPRPPPLPTPACSDIAEPKARASVPRRRFLETGDEVHRRLLQQGEGPRAARRLLRRLRPGEAVLSLCLRGKESPPPPPPGSRDALPPGGRRSIAIGSSHGGAGAPRQVCPPARGSHRRRISSGATQQDVRIAPAIHPPRRKSRLARSALSSTYGGTPGAWRVEVGGTEREPVRRRFGGVSRPRPPPPASLPPH